MKKQNNKTETDFIYGACGHQIKKGEVYVKNPHTSEINCMQCFCNDLDKIISDDVIAGPEK